MIEVEKKETNVYSYSVVYTGFDKKSTDRYGIVISDTYQDAVAQITEYYGESSITETNVQRIEMSCLNDGRTLIDKQEFDDAMGDYF